MSNQQVSNRIDLNLGSESYYDSNLGEVVEGLKVNIRGGAGILTDVQITEVQGTNYIWEVQKNYMRNDTTLEGTLEDCTKK